MPRIRIAETRGELQVFAQTLTPETMAEHTYLQYAHEKLQHLLSEVDRLTQERDFHTASKQRKRRRIEGAGRSLGRVSKECLPPFTSPVSSVRR